MGKKDSLMAYWQESGVVHDSRILKAFAEIPREIFVAPQVAEFAYEDHPLPTIRGQSLSQPTTAMIMTQALDVQPGQKVFEVGAGVGYQACLLSALAGKKGKVISTEVIPELVQVAKYNVEKLRLPNVEILEADCSRGVPEQAPFDRIIITAACRGIPPPLIEQTKIGGIIVAPVGDKHEQVMVKAIRTAKGLELEFLGPFVFVPLQGKYGFETEDKIDVG